MAKKADTTAALEQTLTKPLEGYSEVPPSLQDLADHLSSRAGEAAVKKLLADAAQLQAWQNAASPTNAQRDAMTKLGSDWHVPQKIAGKKRKPEEVAKDLEKEFTDTAQRLLQKAQFFTAKHSAAKTQPASSSSAQKAS